MLSLFDYGSYQYSISDKQANYKYTIMKIKLVVYEKHTHHSIVETRVVRTKNKKAIKKAILNGRFEEFKKIK